MAATVVEVPLTLATMVLFGCAVVLFGDETDDEEDDDARERDVVQFLARLQSMELVEDDDDDDDDDKVEEGVIKPVVMEEALLVVVMMLDDVQEPGPVGDEHELEPEDELVSCSSRSVSVRQTK